MIDTTIETLKPLRQAAEDWLPLRPDGRRHTYATIYRWATGGVSGVQLETVRLGGCIYTTREAIDRFGASLTRTKPPARPTPPTSNHRRDDAACAAEGL